MKHVIASLFACLLLSLSLSAQPAETQKGYKRLTAALHVHSRFSNGEYGILELSAFAHQKKTDVLGITDSFLTRVRYGVGPFKKLMSRTMSRPAVLDRGLDAYLGDFEQAQRQFDDVVLLPGLEVAPSYYWEGRWPGDLVLHDFDRHLLLFGLKDRSAIRNIPVIENATWSNTERTWSCAIGPFVCLLLATFLIIRVSRALKLAGAFILLIAVVWSYDAYPYGSLSNPYSGESDERAYQRVIDYTVSHGGLAFWSYPEARYPDIQITGSRARMVSRGEPESLPLTEGYRGFEGLYGDNITITKPGNLWDRLLMEYVQGSRKAWPSVITGIDFHSFKPGNGWYQLDQGITVLFAREKTEAGVLEAMKSGRGYSSFQDNPLHHIALEDFALRSNGNVAVAGETLEAAGSVDVSARVDWVSPDGPFSESSADVTLIRDGEVLEEYASRLPVVVRRSNALAPGRHYYRIMVKFRGTQILSNPIFCVSL